MKVKINNPKTSTSNELRLSDKIERYNDLKTCVSNLSRIVPLDEFELYQNKQDQIVLLDLNDNRTHGATDFCIDTRHDSFFNFSSIVAKICYSFCANEYSICVQFCCPKGKFGDLCDISTDSDWKPKALIDAEEIGLGRSLYNMMPKCADHKIDSFETNDPIDILENGNLDWGNELN